MAEIDFDFVPMGTVAKPEKGKVYVDVGNAFCPGVLDHHHPDAPDACTAMLTLNHPEYIFSQILNRSLTIIPHEYPDLDALTGVYFSRMHANQEPVHEAHCAWAEYVCKVDQGYTTLLLETPISPYSIFMMRMQLIRKKKHENIHMAMLKTGLQFIDQVIQSLSDGVRLCESGWLESLFPLETELIIADYSVYLKDIEQATISTYRLPLKDGGGYEYVPGLWIRKPESVFFKSWARGDQRHSDSKQGFIFLAIQISDQRFILSVQPNANVWLKGLGDKIEQAETLKRKKMNLVRNGEVRSGYESSDPWYNGRSPLHHYSIIDSPRCGTVLTVSEVRSIIGDFVND